MYHCNAPLAYPQEVFCLLVPIARSAMIVRLYPRSNVKLVIAEVYITVMLEGFSFQCPEVMLKGLCVSSHG